jgi:sigma-B regulation protein RsbU (phosphoserine phosphatase)
VDHSLAPLEPAALSQLQGLQALTDSNLTKLDIEDFLGELLSRVRDILNADTAAVLLLDESTNQLVATAAQGIEEEVRQGVRVPVGSGFAGTIAARREPLLLDRVDSTTVSNRILWEKGIQAMLGVPLLSQNRVIGVLHVGRLKAAPFTPDDAELLQVVAERVAGATQSIRFAIERSAATQLERSLLPGRMPACPDLDFATIYLTPEDRTVGGDWYDGFFTPSGDLWVVVGDVAGRGLGAAVIMGRIKSALRSYALLERSPEETIELTARKLAHFEPEALATVICAVTSPPYRKFRIASAGHPPPMVASLEGTQLLEMQVGPPLGTAGHERPSTTTVTLEDGGVLLLYTDGLVERRDEDISEGFERLRALVAREPPEVLCRRIVSTVIGPSGPRDDVAMVAIQRQGDTGPS